MRSISITIMAFVFASCQTNPDKAEKTKELAPVEQVAFVSVIDSLAIEILIPEPPVIEPLVISIPKKTLKGLPDFTQYRGVNEKKKAFFDFFRPMIEKENNRIRKERTKIKTLFNTYDETGEISEKDSRWLLDISKGMRMKDFNINNQDDKKTLLRKKDIVPTSMFLAQAANESSWGTSRFAREANNLFGQWCYTPGCGIVPSERQGNEKHEVRKFASINDAVKSYVRNINSYYAYKELRTIREELRKEGKVPDGKSLTNGLIKYSIRGEEYVKEIQSIIRTNKLEEVK